jgi:hypothetical protein
MLGTGLGCFEMRLGNADDYGVAMPYAEPMRYVALKDALANANSQVASVLLTGSAYA